MRRRLVPLMAVLLMAGCGGPSDRQAQSPPAQAAPAAAAPPAREDTSGVPPIPFADAARPPDVVRAVYTFAADHPEILGKVPCFCGCQRLGHRNNDDCFVAARDEAGRVSAWEPHGAT